jgi:membrane protein DedA with SNARE-associated domain
MPPLRHLVSNSLGAVLAVVALLIVPRWFGISLETLLRLQPDLGGALVLGAAVAIADAALKIWLGQVADGSGQKRSKGTASLPQPSV